MIFMGKYLFLTFAQAIELVTAREVFAFTIWKSSQVLASLQCRENALIFNLGILCGKTNLRMPKAYANIHGTLGLKCNTQ